MKLLDNKEDEENEIIINLVDYSKEGEGKYAEAFVDFRLRKDYRLFLSDLNIKNEREATVIHFLHFVSSKRLRRGAYYKLNTKLLTNVKQFTNNEGYQEESPLVGYVYDFDYKENDDDELLLEAHAPLDPEDILFSSGGSEMTLVLPHSKYTLRVNNVGQGNCNEIIDDSGRVKIIYDMGASLHASTQKVTSLLNTRLTEYKKSNPILFISHWDLDHIVQLAVMNDNDIKGFAGVICCSKMTSMTSQRVYKKLVSQLTKSKVMSLDPPTHISRGHSKMRAIKRGGNFVLYQGEMNSNINYCGLVLMLFGDNGSALLTGDCSLTQASSILLNERSNICHRSLNMVEPHHGGDFSARLRVFTIPSQYTAKDALISVDENDNSYGHPNKRVLGMLQSTFQTVKRTDKSGDLYVQF